MSGCCAAEKYALKIWSISTEISSTRLTSAAPDRLEKSGAQDWRLRRYRVRAPRTRQRQFQVSLRAQSPRTKRECGDQQDRSPSPSYPLRKFPLTWHFAPSRSRLPHEAPPERLSVLGWQKPHPLEPIAGNPQPVPTA